MEKIIGKPAKADNTAYTLRANALALRDIAPFGRTVYILETLYEMATLRFNKKKCYSRR